MRWNCTQGPDARSSHRKTPRDPSIRRWTPGKRSDGLHPVLAISLAVLCIGSGFPLDVSYTYDDLGQLVRADYSASDEEEVETVRSDYPRPVNYHIRGRGTASTVQSAKTDPILF